MYIVYTVVYYIPEGYVKVVQATYVHSKNRLVKKNYQSNWLTPYWLF